MGVSEEISSFTSPKAGRKIRREGGKEGGAKKERKKEIIMKERRKESREEEKTCFHSKNLYVNNFKVSISLPDLKGKTKMSFSPCHMLVDLFPLPVKNSVFLSFSY